MALAEIITYTAHGTITLVVYDIADPDTVVWAGMVRMKKTYDMADGSYSMEAVGISGDPEQPMLRSMTEKIPHDATSLDIAAQFLKLTQDVRDQIKVYNAMGA